MMMPVPRKKSCQQCRHAKARCSLDPICSRCTERGFHCDYAGTSSSRSIPYSLPVSTAAAPTNQLQAMTDMAHMSAQTALGWGGGPGTGFGPSGYAVGNDRDTGIQVQLGQGGEGKGRKSVGTPNTHASMEQERQRAMDLPHHMIPHSLSSTPSSWTSGWNDFPDQSDWQQQPDTRLARGSKPDGWDSWAPDSGLPWFSQPRLFNVYYEPAPPEHPAWAQSHQPNTDDYNSALHHMTVPRGESPQSFPAASTTTTTSTPSLIGSPNATHQAIHGHRSKPILSRRPIGSNEDGLNAQVVIGQISQYPRMLIGQSGNQGKLPPFIHPQCVLFDTQPSACVADGVHRCLLGPLANCASLVKLFYGRSVGNLDFVWGAIYNEVKRLRDEYLAYDHETLLAANQALTLYLLLQIEDRNSVDNNNVAFLTQTTTEVNLRLYTMLPFLNDIFTMENFNRRSWALSESMRRTVCLLAIIELIYVAFHDEIESTQFGGIKTCPLPCARDLWDSDEAEPWAVRLMRFMREREVLLSDTQRFPDESNSHNPPEASSSLLSADNGLPVITVGDLRFVCGFNPSDYVPPLRRQQQHGVMIREFRQVLQDLEQKQAYQSPRRSHSPDEQQQQTNPPLALNNSLNAGINNIAASIRPNSGVGRDSIDKQILTQQVSRWCETLDEYGVMVWMATCVEPKRMAMRTALANQAATASGAT